MTLTGTLRNYSNLVSSAVREMYPKLLQNDFTTDCPASSQITRSQAEHTVEFQSSTSRHLKKLIRAERERKKEKEE